MKSFVIAALFAASAAGSAGAGRHCTVDLEPLISVHFLRTVTDDATTRDFFSAGDLLLSKGGAVTLMRTDDSTGAGKTRTFLAGQLESAPLERLRAALDRVTAGAAPVDCFVESSPDPPTGKTTFGGSEVTVYRGGEPPLRFNVQHSDPDVPVPHCTPVVQALDDRLFALEDALRRGVRPFQCQAAAGRSDP